MVKQERWQKEEKYRTIKLLKGEQKTDFKQDVEKARKLYLEIQRVQRLDLDNLEESSEELELKQKLFHLY